MATVTTSIRMSADLKKRIERTAKRLKKNRNEVMVEAVEKFLQENDVARHREEMKRVSALIAEHDRTSDDAAYWDRVIDEATNELWK